MWAKRKQRGIGTLPIIGLACFAILIIVWIHLPIRSSSARGSPGRWTVGIGREGKLDSGAEYAVVLDSRESLDEWLEAEITHDTSGKSQLTAAGKAMLVPSGDRVLVLDWDSIRKTPATIHVSKVRILDGRYAGSSGWAAASQVK